MPVDSVCLLNMGDKDKARQTAKDELVTFLMENQDWSQTEQAKRFLDRDHDAEQSGYCLALCLYWIDARRRDKHEARGGDWGAMSKPHVMRAAEKVQALYAEVTAAATADGESNRKAGRDAIQLVAGGLDIAIEGETEGNSGGGTVKAALPLHGRYGLIALRGFGNGHALAVYSQRSGFLRKHHHHIFDPNWGEFRVPDSRFEEFFDLLILTYRLFAMTYNEACLFELSVKTDGKS